MEIDSVNSQSPIPSESRQPSRAEVTRSDQKPAYEVEISQEAIDARNQELAKKEAIMAEQQAQANAERARATEERKIDDSGYVEPDEISG